jgi:hypothetical protein
MRRLLQQLTKGIKKSLTWVIIGILVLGWVFIRIWAQVREVPHLDDPEIIVFQTGIIRPYEVGTRLSGNSRITGCRPVEVTGRLCANRTFYGHEE